MKIFLDTAKVEEIREAAALGILDGVTTNPSLVASSGRKREEVIAEICGIVNGSVSAEVIATTRKEMIAEGRALAKIHPNVTVKIPMIEEGLPAIKALSDDGIKVNVTLVFQPVQAMMAAKAGATFVSPFVGRLDDIGQDGMALIREIRAIFDNYGYGTEILAASIRHPYHVRDAALAGADVSTIPMTVLKAMLRHPLTDSGLEKFLADYRKTMGAA